jgi:chorismate mutase/prephenate dehydrogenase
MVVAAIIGGSGRMGEWFANFLASSGYEVVIYDKNEPATQKLKRAYRGITNERQVAEAANIILFATPTHTTNTLLKKIAAHAPRTTLLIEISSIKKPLRRTVEALARKGVQILSIHPMFGPGAQTISNKTVLLAHQPGQSRVAEGFLSTLRSKGAKIIRCNLDTHDRIAAATLALPHLMNFAFVDTLRREGLSLERARQLGGTTFRLQLLIAEALYHESVQNEASILHDNRHSQEFFRVFAQQVDEFRDLVRGKSHTDLIKHIRNSASYARKDRSFRTAYERFVSAVEASDNT